MIDNVRYGTSNCFVEFVEAVVCDMQIEGKHLPGRPKTTWRTLSKSPL